MILKYFKKSICYLLSVSIVVLSIACEDDPLLEPQSDSEVDAGSYGMLYLSEEDNEDEEEPNPEVY
tara:strand:- start:1447 stop:1644 length:198 start_codon:yes stop_codon:yes gene_type:complete